MSKTKAMPSTLHAFLLSVLTAQVLSSRISFFSDGACQSFQYDVQGPNGYPSGDCSLLNSKGNYSSFKVVRLDRGCDVTLYGPDTTQGICSPGGSLVSTIGRCYNESSWTYYSIDTCSRQPDDESSISSSSSQTTLSSTSTSISTSTGTNAPSTIRASLYPEGSSTASTSATSGSSSSTNTGVIAGGVVGGVAGLALVVGAVWFFLRRRRRECGAARLADSPVEMGGEPMIEMSAREKARPTELPAPRAEDSAEQPPQELSADTAKEIRVSRGEKPPL